MKRRLQTTRDCFTCLGSVRNDLGNGFVWGERLRLRRILSPTLIIQAVIAMEEQLKQSVNLHYMPIMKRRLQTTKDCFASLGSVRNDLGNGFVWGERLRLRRILSPSRIVQAVIAMEEQLKQSKN